MFSLMRFSFVLILILPKYLHAAAYEKYPVLEICDEYVREIVDTFEIMYEEHKKKVNPRKSFECVEDIYEILNQEEHVKLSSDWIEEKMSILSSMDEQLQKDLANCVKGVMTEVMKNVDTGGLEDCERKLREMKVEGIKEEWKK